MAKNNTSILFIIGIVVIVFLLIKFPIQKKESQMSVIYYDKNGNEMDWKGYEPYNYEEAIKSPTMQRSNVSGLFSIVQQSAIFTLPLYTYRTYVKDLTTNDYDLYSTSMIRAGSTGASSTPDEYMALIRFQGSKPSNLVSYSQITSITFGGQVSSYSTDEGSTELGFGWLPQTYSGLDSSYSYNWWNEINSMSMSFQKNPIPPADTFSGEITTSAGMDLFAKGFIDIGMKGEHDLSGTEDANLATVSGVLPQLTISYNYESCSPETCSSLGKQCGSWGDTCNGVVECGSCSTGYSCDVNGQCVSVPSGFKLAILATNTGDTIFDNVGVITGKLNWNGTTSSDSVWCYQGQANQATTCGGSGGGSYRTTYEQSYSGSMYAIEDGNWDSWATASPIGTVYYSTINYTLPANLNLSKPVIWTVKDSASVMENPLGPRNITLNPSKYIRAGKQLSLKAVSHNGYQTYWMALNLYSYAWDTLSLSTRSPYYIYEEGIFWSLPTTPTPVSGNILNIFPEPIYTVSQGQSKQINSTVIPTQNEWAGKKITFSSLVTYRDSYKNITSTYTPSITLQF